MPVAGIKKIGSARACRSKRTLRVCALPSDVLAWVDEHFGAGAAQMSSFGLEDVALFDMFWRINPQARLITLDTWRLPTETYTVMDQTRLRYNAGIEVYQPDPASCCRNGR